MLNPFLYIIRLIQIGLEKVFPDSKELIIQTEMIPNPIGKLELHEVVGLVDEHPTLLKLTNGEKPSKSKLFNVSYSYKTCRDEFQQVTWSPVKIIICWSKKEVKEHFKFRCYLTKLIRKTY